MYTAFRTYEKMALDAFYALLDSTPSEEHRRALGKMSTISELRSIIMHLPRQTGKTTILAKLAKRHPEAKIVVPNMSMKKCFMDNHSMPRDRVFTIHDFRIELWCGRSLNIPIYLFDEPQHISDSNWEEFYELLSVNGISNVDPIFFGLGTGGFL